MNVLLVKFPFAGTLRPPVFSTFFNDSRMQNYTKGPMQEGFTERSAQLRFFVIAGRFVEFPGALSGLTPV
jgi:hypothetical protein